MVDYPSGYPYTYDFFYDPYPNEFVVGELQLMMYYKMYKLSGGKYTFNQYRKNYDRNEGIGYRDSVTKRMDTL